MLLQIYVDKSTLYFGVAWSWFCRYINIFHWLSSCYLAWNIDPAEGNAERVCPNTDTEIQIQELILLAENQLKNLRWQII